MTEKRKPGRPPTLADEGARPEVLRVRFSKASREAIERAAKEAGKRPAVWLHDAALHEIELQRKRLRRRR